MASEEDVVLMLILRRRRKRRKYKQTVRTIHVNTYLSERIEKGIFDTSYEDLRLDDDKFFRYFRMSKLSFDELLVCVPDKFRKVDSTMRKAIPREEKLAVTLRYLGTGTSMSELYFQYQLGVSTIFGIIREVCSALWESTRTFCFPTLTENMWRASARGFFLRANFPHCLTAID
ncbi:hypothetical protein PR048_017946 [Dryococelus australis]|uniref:Nuclease HARBI1 n=1 Tax=Dryococelus australis TaxID=614101 RepID=A0ABQ9HB27_9NEOP|nr:hypothetical protein PR048_017946 [Dryococelus australis]